MFINIFTKKDPSLSNQIHEHRTLHETFIFENSSNQIPSKTKPQTLSDLTSNMIDRQADTPPGPDWWDVGGPLRLLVLESLIFFLSLYLQIKSVCGSEETLHLNRYHLMPASPA